MKVNILIIISLFAIKGFCQDTILFKNKNLIIYKKRASFKGKELYNGEREKEKFIKQEKMDGCPVEYEFYYNPLSLIGNYYSYESGHSERAACGPLGNSVSVQTIDLKTNKAISLSDIFTEESILRALKEDVWVRKMEKETKKNFQPIASFKVFLDTLNSLGWAKFKSNSFAILDYNKKNGKVAVRFVGTEYMGFDHNKYFQLGLWLKPKKQYKRLFKNKIHFRMGDYKSRLKK